MTRATPLRRPEEDPALCNLRDRDRGTFYQFRYLFGLICNFPKGFDAPKQIAKAVSSSYSVTSTLKYDMFASTWFSNFIVTQIPSEHSHSLRTVF